MHISYKMHVVLQCSNFAIDFIDCKYECAVLHPKLDKLGKECGTRRRYRKSIVLYMLTTIYSHDANAQEKWKLMKTKLNNSLHTWVLLIVARSVYNMLIAIRTLYIEWLSQPRVYFVHCLRIVCLYSWRIIRKLANKCKFSEHLVPVLHILKCRHSIRLALSRLNIEIIL